MIAGFFTRFLITLIFFGGLIVGAIIIFIASLSSNTFTQGVLVNIATTFIGIAVTVGGVDLLLNLHSKKQRRLSVAPMVMDLIEVLNVLKASHGRYLSLSSLDDIERYRRVMEEINSKTFGIYILLSAQETAIAGKLLNFYNSTKELVYLIEDLIIYKRNASLDYPQMRDSVRMKSQTFLGLNSDIITALSEEFKQDYI